MKICLALITLVSESWLAVSETHIPTGCWNMPNILAPWHFCDDNVHLQHYHSSSPSETPRARRLRSPLRPGLNQAAKAIEPFPCCQIIAAAPTSGCLHCIIRIACFSS